MIHSYSLSTEIVETTQEFRAKWKEGDTVFTADGVFLVDDNGDLRDKEDLEQHILEQRPENQYDEDSYDI
jgi:hypothetical protein